MREVCFDGLVGPTHSYAGLSPGNVAAMRHAGEIGNPRAAALEGLAKMRFALGLGAARAVLPPHPRPDVGALRRLGFSGSDAEVIARAAKTSPELVRAVSSASAMWTANAATVVPSADSADGRVHLVVASLSSLFHRSLEAPVTARVLRAIFASDRFVVHDALPLSDEGAANHTRLEAAHVFGWGRRVFGEAALPKRFPARQALEASEAVARLAGLAPERALFWQQHPDGIDAGAFHTDVLAVGTGSFFMLHELAFVDARACVSELERRGVNVVLATEREFPVADAVASYAFNSELVELADGGLALIAPSEARENASARAFLERAAVRERHFVDVNASMKNGGGPACLRLRVPLTEQERSELGGRVLLDAALLDELEAWVTRHYRDRLGPDDLKDPALLEETRTALDELTQMLGLGAIYDFQT